MPCQSGCVPNTAHSDVCVYVYSMCVYVHYMYIRCGGHIGCVPNTAHSEHIYIYTYVHVYVYIYTYMIYIYIYMIYIYTYIYRCFLGFSTQSHAESFGNYIKKSFLDPKRAKSYEKSAFGYVQWLSRSPGPVQWLSRKTSPCQGDKLLLGFCFSRHYAYPFLSSNL